MPPLPVIPDTYRAAFNWNDSGQTAVNVMHFRRASSSSAAVASLIDANVTAAMWGMIANGASVVRLDVTALDGASATFSLVTTGAKWAGGAGVTDPLIAVAQVIKLQTTLRGRRHRGRIYLPFTGENQTVGGSLLSASVTSVQNAWNTFLTATIAAGLPPVVASYRGASQLDVSSFVVETLVGTQRRRQTRLRGA